MGQKPKTRGKGKKQAMTSTERSRLSRQRKKGN